MRWFVIVIAAAAIAVSAAAGPEDQPQPYLAMIINDSTAIFQTWGWAPDQSLHVYICEPTHQLDVPHARPCVRVQRLARLDLGLRFPQRCRVARVASDSAPTMQTVQARR